MSTKHFTELLRRYLEDTITPAQRAELMAMVRQGGYEAELGNSIEATMINEIPAADLDAETSDAIVRYILDRGRDK